MRHRRHPAALAAIAVAICGLAGCATATPAGGPAGPPTTSAMPDATPAEPMSVDRFWAIVDGTPRAGATAQAEVLLPRLSALSKHELAGYQRRFVQLANAIATSLHYAAAEVVMGYASQDAFVDFRTWVVYQGRATYDAFVAEPDSLADRGPTGDDQLGAAELLEFLPDQAAGGAPSWAADTLTVYIDPTGTRVDEDYSTLRQRFRAWLRHTSRLT